MTDLQHRIDAVARKAELLTTLSEQLRIDKTRALSRIAELEATVAAQAKEIETLTMKLEYLTVVAVVEPSAAERDAVRQRLQRLLNDIDRCIADLSDSNER